MPEAKLLATLPLKAPPNAGRRRKSMNCRFVPDGGLMQGPDGKVHGPVGFAVVGGASRNPWRVSMSKQQSAMIEKPGMQSGACVKSGDGESGFVSAAKSASMLLKKRSLIDRKSTRLNSSH